MGIQELRTTAGKIDFLVIGGSGVYDLKRGKDVQSIEVTTPFGATSSPILIKEIGTKRVAFLARHGKGHVMSPSFVPYRANIWAAKALGVERILSINACGSLDPEFAPVCTLTVPNQLIDMTRLRDTTFFDQREMVAHMPAGEPIHAGWAKEIGDAVETVAPSRLRRGGTMVVIEGPRYSTHAESVMFHAWGANLIGMTITPEAFLAKEAGMAYASISHVTDVDSVDIEDIVTVEMVNERMAKNVDAINDAIVRLCEVEFAEIALHDPMRDLVSPQPEGTTFLDLFPAVE
jgi:5'-methylthioadenosine phosphorylase